MAKAVSEGDSANSHSTSAKQDKPFRWGIFISSKRIHLYWYSNRFIKVSNVFLLADRLIFFTMTPHSTWKSIGTVRISFMFTCHRADADRPATSRKTIITDRLEKWHSVTAKAHWSGHSPVWCVRQRMVMFSTDMKCSIQAKGQRRPEKHRESESKSVYRTQRGTNPEGPLISLNFITKGTSL